MSLRFRERSISELEIIKSLMSWGSKSPSITIKPTPGTIVPPGHYEIIGLRNLIHLVQNFDGLCRVDHSRVIILSVLDVWFNQKEKEIQTNAPVKEATN